MVTQLTEKLDAAFDKTEVRQLPDEYRESIRQQAEALLGKSGTDFKLMSIADIEALVFEFQVHQIELELQNEALKKTHQELTVSRDDFARIYNLSPIAYLTMNEQGVIKRANQAAGYLLGYSDEALINQELGKFIHTSDQDSYYFFLQDLVLEKNNKILNLKLETQHPPSVRSECQGVPLLGCSRALCHHNNPYTFVELRGSVSANGSNEIQIALAIQDITEYIHSQETISCLNEKLEQRIVAQTSALMASNRRLTDKIKELRQSKQQLRDREARLNAIFNASIEGIIILDAFGTMVSVNNAVKAIFGYCEEELIGYPINNLIPESENIQHREESAGFAQTAIAGLVGKIREAEGIRRDGMTVPIDLSVAEFSISGASYYTVIVRDVSVRKMQEQQDKAHLDELAHVTRIGLMGEMASGIAHEINQPLTAIASYSQACINFIQAEKPDLAQLGKILNNMLEQALRAGQIIHHMRDFVKAKTRTRSTVDVNNLIRISIGLCASDLKHSNIIQTLKLADNLPAISIDSVQIEQVLLNLIRNSIDVLKALPPEIPRKLTIQSYLNADNYIVFKIKDNGKGIAEADREKILTPFFTTKPDGMGMGLSICNSIIKAHQGVISFNSKPGKGTTFYFTLPTHGKLNGQ